MVLSGELAPLSISFISRAVTLTNEQDTLFMLRIRSDQ